METARERERRVCRRRVRGMRVLARRAARRWARRRRREEEEEEEEEEGGCLAKLLLLALCCFWGVLLLLLLLLLLLAHFPPSFPSPAAEANVSSTAVSPCKDKAAHRAKSG